MAAKQFDFASGNLRKLLALPKYLLSMVIALVVPRNAVRWIFGSGIGIGEGALAVAIQLQRQDPSARIQWCVFGEQEAAEAVALGFEPVQRRGWRGYWATLRAGHIIVTHGLGDVNRFGVFGGRVINLIHGAPLKRLHLDSPVTTQVRGPAILRVLMQRMYQAGTNRTALYVAGSTLAAERLRSAYRVLPGKVRVLGDPRDDVLCEQTRDPLKSAAAAAQVRTDLGLPDVPAGHDEPLILYAPTWRDGDPDPGVPTSDESRAILATLSQLNARLLVRSHPLGSGAYDELIRIGAGRVHMFGGDTAKDITPLLGAFDVIMTDYSSIAVDFSLFGRPIVWFAPDLESYSATRGLYEPLEVTAVGQVKRDWASALERLAAVLPPHSPHRSGAQADARALAARFHEYPKGQAASRVLAQIRKLSAPDEELVPAGAVFFESFYGQQASCNPLALDREIAVRMPGLPRLWSVTNERVNVPDGAIPVLVGSREWYAARRRSQLLIVNDWLRLGFRAGRHQTVLQTWHGTMLKRLALDRPRVGLRSRIAIHRESRRWTVMLSQNQHSTAQFRSSYAFRGEVLELGYPRDDRLANSVGGAQRISIAAHTARRCLGIAPDARVLAYTPTWRDSGGTVDMLDVRALATDLGEGWTIVARGHTRSLATYLGIAQAPGSARIVDASGHPDVNDVILAADLLITDYSSVMFDAAVARVPMAFFVPDLTAYRDRERGFTFDFEAEAPGPLLSTREQVLEVARGTRPLEAAKSASYEAWRERFTPHDDGSAASRVIEALIERGALTA